MPDYYIPSTINVHPPDHARTKGSGKRIKEEKKKAIEKVAKGRLCHGCKKLRRGSWQTQLSYFERKVSGYKLVFLYFYYDLIPSVIHEKMFCNLSSATRDEFVYNESQASTACTSIEERVEDLQLSTFNDNFGNFYAS